MLVVVMLLLMLLLLLLLLLWLVDYSKTWISVMMKTVTVFVIVCY